MIFTDLVHSSVSADVACSMGLPKVVAQTASTRQAGRLRY